MPAEIGMSPEGQLGVLHRATEAYYTRAISRHGAEPLGVDWRCAASQEMRFVQLLKACDFSAPFSLNDLGCGYGALVGFLRKRHAGAAIDYVGIDLSPAMIAAARRLWRRTRFMVGSVCPGIADYSVASGIFNVKLDQPRAVWERFVTATLRDLHAASRRAFAVNFLAPTAPGQPAVTALYRTAPAPWIRYCERELGGGVDLIADYGLREFTLIVRKAEALSRTRPAGASVPLPTAVRTRSRRTRGSVSPHG